MLSAFVRFDWQSFVDFADRIFGKRVVGQIFDWLSSQLPAIYENPSLVAFDQNAVVGVVANDHFSTAGVGHVEHELRCGVVAIVLHRISVLVFHWMLGFSADRKWPFGLAVQLKRLVANVDVMSAPVS